MSVRRCTESSRDVQVARGRTRWAGANPEQKRAARRLWDGGGRVMLARGPQGVGKTTLPQAGGSALRAGTAGHKALSNLGTSGQRMYHPLRPRAWPACREKGRPCADHNLMPGK